jgi:small-conductance mechanosensitive channel|tara:strand:- start:4076 stop:5215 length:1140 start_codon:yes stop_codon:yes gene_type:complete
MFGNSSSGSLVIPELFTWSETIASLITLLCFAIAGITLSWAINRYIHKWVGGTSNNYDDLILQSVRGPITWELILFGLLTTTQTTSYIGDVTAEAAFSIIQALMIVVAALGVQKIITGLIEEFATKPQSGPDEDFQISDLIDAKALPFWRRLFNVVVISLGVLFVFQALGVQISPILAGLGIGGIAVALAIQPLLSNLIASSFMLSDSSLRVGDLIEIEGTTFGYVDDIGWRATRVRTFDNNIVMIPNATLANSTVTNYDSTDPAADARLVVGVAYEVDLDHVEQVCREILESLKNDFVEITITEKDPVVLFTAFGDSNIDILLKIRSKTLADSYTLKHELLKRTHKRFQEENIVINYPARRLILEEGDTTGLIRSPNI